MASKTKYSLLKTKTRASYFGSKLAVVPVVALVDTGTAAVIATTTVIKTAATAVWGLLKAPIGGVARGNQIHKVKYSPKYQENLDRADKLASGKFVETLVPSQDI